MKAHIGVDSESGLMRVVVSMPPNIADVTQIEQLLTGKEKTLPADAGYTGAEEYAQGKAKLRVTAKRGTLNCMVEGALKDATPKLEKQMAQMRGCVEIPFRVPNCQFGLAKVRYRGLANNAAQQQVLFALANLSLARRRLAAAG